MTGYAIRTNGLSIHTRTKEKSSADFARIVIFNRMPNPSTYVVNSVALAGNSLCSFDFLIFQNTECVFKQVLEGKLSSMAHRIKHITKLYKSSLYHLYFYSFFKKRYKGLNLGSGGTIIDNFANVDANVFTKSDFVASIFSIKLANNSVDNIYNSHVFEHVPRSKALDVLKEWYRILNKGGKLYICVPDIEVLIKLYITNLGSYNDIKAKETVDLACNVMYGGQVNKYDFHHYGYSFATLSNLLTTAGFINIRRFVKDDVFFVNFNDASSATINGVPISLNIVAEK
jgi:predicted SAM-dependent methyltransferase